MNNKPSFWVRFALLLACAAIVVAAVNTVWPNLAQNFHIPNPWSASGDPGLAPTDGTCSPVVLDPNVNNNFVSPVADNGYPVKTFNDDMTALKKDPRSIQMRLVQLHFPDAPMFWQPLMNGNCLSKAGVDFYNRIYALYKGTDPTVEHTDIDENSEVPASFCNSYMDANGGGQDSSCGISGDRTAIKYTIHFKDGRIVVTYTMKRCGNLPFEGPQEHMRVIHPWSPPVQTTTQRPCTTCGCQGQPACERCDHCGCQGQPTCGCNQCGCQGQPACGGCDHCGCQGQQPCGCDQCGCEGQPACQTCTVCGCEGYPPCTVPKDPNANPPAPQGGGQKDNPGPDEPRIPVTPPPSFTNTPQAPPPPEPGPSAPSTEPTHVEAPPPAPGVQPPAGSPGVNGDGDKDGRVGAPVVFYIITAPSRQLVSI